MADIYSMFASPDDATAEEQAHAMSAALRKQQSLGQLALLSGDPILGKLGASQLEDAGSQQHLLATAGGQRLTRALQVQREAREKATQDRELAQGDRRLGIEAGRAGAENWVPASGANGIYLVNKKTGESKPLLDNNGNPVAPKGAGGGGNADKALQKMMEALDPNRAKSGVLADNQKRINAVERLLSLATDPKTGEAMDLDPRQMRELATSLNGVLTSGALGAESGIHDLIPQTMRGNLAKFEEYIGNTPAGTGQREFVHRMVDTAKRERDVAKRLIREAQVQRLPAFAGLKTDHPTEYGGLLQSYGLGDGGLPGQGGAAPAGAPSDGTVRVLAPSGKVKVIPAAQLQAALAAGGKQVE